MKIISNFHNNKFPSRLKSVINCDNTHILQIPKELVKLKILDCSYTKITEIPKELVNLQYFLCYYTKIQRENVKLPPGIF